MRVAMLLVVVGVVLSGCTRVIDISGAEWRRPNTAIRQETWDEVECARATEYAGDLPDTIVGGLADMIVVPLEDSRRGAAFDRCMVAKGYERVAAEPR
jgi:uncharacterized protein YceK